MKFRFPLRYRATNGASKVKRAYRPDRNQLITVRAYVAEYGGKYERLSTRDSRPYARCPACLEPMKVVGEDRQQHDPHFSHIAYKGEAPPCPLRNIADHKYEFLVEQTEESERGRMIRRNFFQNWQKHWGLFRKCLGQIADIGQFVALIHIADKTKLWYRARLSEWEIPYIFLVWQDYPPMRGKDGAFIRRAWYRFWFDARTRTLDDLWIRTSGQFRIIRAEYSIPRDGKAPRLTHLRDSDVLDICPDFLVHPAANVPEYVVRRMHQAFCDELTSAVRTS